MNRIPTEGLKPMFPMPDLGEGIGLNEQNPDRGIETNDYGGCNTILTGLNEQNPDRGIET